MLYPTSIWLFSLKSYIMHIVPHYFIPIKTLLTNVKRRMINSSVIHQSEAQMQKR